MENSAECAPSAADHPSSLAQNAAADVLTICFNSLKRSRRTVKDFVRSYYPLLGVDPLHFLEHWDILVFVEATIYQLDEEVERAALAGAGSPADFQHPALAALKAVLQQRGLLTVGVQQEISQGVEYWRGECRLSECMLRNGRVPANGHDVGFTVGEVHAASAAKSFDYRVLNHVLHALYKATPDPELLAFLRVDETLLDLGDDIVDYEDDILSNSFNIFRAYCHLYGTSAPLRLIERIGELEARHAQLLADLPPALQAKYKLRQAEAAEGEGALRWMMPTPILREAEFRIEHANGHADSDG